MNQRTALYTALALTAFVIIATASVALAWPALRQAETSSSLATAPEELAAPETLTANESIDTQALLATVQVRDEAYRNQIEQANQQVSEAYQRLAELESQNNELLQREQVYQQRLQENNVILSASYQQPLGAAASDYDAYESHDGDSEYDDAYDDDSDDGNSQDNDNGDHNEKDDD